MSTVPARNDARVHGSRWLWFLAAASFAACAGSGHDPTQGDRPGSSASATSGKSAIEDRYVYAPPDEGEFTVPLSLDISLPGEFSIQEPSMVAGDARVHVRYSRHANVVDCELDAHGLPYRPDFAKKRTDSTPFNAQLTQIKGARWQLWLAGTMFGRQHEDLFYSRGVPRTFFGTRYDFPPIGSRAPPWPGSVELFQGNARQMVGLPPFDPQPNGDVHLHFTLRYDRITDAWDTPGSVNMLLPLDGCKPEALSNYWTDSRLPAEKYMSWDTFLESVWSGEGIGFMVSAEPYARPEWMAFRTSPFVGWANVYPAAVPRGFGLDFRTFGTLVAIHGQSYELAPWPIASRQRPCLSPR